MFCPKCGQENTESALQCIRCGETLPLAERQYGLGSSVPTLPREVVNNNLVWAILATLFCCLPTGIVAIVYAAQVDSKVSGGDVVGARQSASNAATWSWISFGLAMVGVIGYVALLIIGVSVRH